MNVYYAGGATHNDHHKEINIGGDVTAETLQQIMADFLSDEDAEPVSGWEYHLVQYGKDEYIKMMDNKNASLEEEVTSTQLALCEVYELIG